jgi:TonB family protein
MLRHAVSRTATIEVPTYYRSILIGGTKISQTSTSQDGPIGGMVLQRTTKSAPSSTTQSTLHQKDASVSQDRPASAEVPVGVLEIPVGVWGPRRVESISGHPGRLEVFSEETCTVIVFPHGAVIRLSRAIEPGQIMMVSNRKSGQHVLCRVVHVREYPSVRGYAEIEFMQPTNGFWGPYIAQGTMKLTQQPKLTVATLEKPPKPDPIVLEPALIQASNETVSAPGPQPPAAKPGPPENFYGSSIPSEMVSSIATTATASPDPPTTVKAKPEPVADCRIQTAHQRSKSANERSALSWVRGLLGSWLELITSTQGATDKAHSPRRTFVLVGATVVGLFIICTTGILLLRNLPAIDDGTDQTNPEFSTLNVQSLRPQSESSSAPVVPVPPVAVNAEGFPGTQARKFADNVPIFHPPTRNLASAGKIPDRKLLAPHWTARPAAAVDQGMPPDVTGLAPNTGADAIQQFLVSSRPVGGRVKEPQLVSKTVPSYPAAARQSGIEGRVMIDAVIDTAGKLTNMRVVSGPPLLQRAALDSLRNWKYQPGYLDDKPVQTKISITVEFRLP